LHLLHLRPPPRPGRVVTTDVYTGKHRREGAPGAPGAPGTPGTGIPAQGKPAWSKAGRLLAAQIVVIAKEPYPGRVKTRLTPPFTPVEAAELWESAMRHQMPVPRR